MICLDSSIESVILEDEEEPSSDIEEGVGDATWEMPEGSELDSLEG